MNKDELLKPRYKVIADWPEMRDRFKNKPIIILDKEDEEGLFTTNGFYQQIFFEKYPHLFKKLEWWEEREEKDMPEYVSYKFMPDSKPRLIKVYKHFFSSFGHTNKYGFLENEESFCSYSKAIPLTKEEYESQNKN